MTKKAAPKATRRSPPAKTTPRAKGTSAPVRFNAILRDAGERLFIRLPTPASQKLPSRGQIAADGTINGHAFETVLEPDGEFGHWVNVDARLAKAARLRLGESVAVEVTPTKEWPEPEVPFDLQKALSASPLSVRDLWKVITPMARWEWVRWVNETKNPATRKRRVEVSISKLSRGSRRPCCFNLAACTDPELSRSGKLIPETTDR
jgi:hypothetical protein